VVDVGEVVARALQMVRFDHRIRQVDMHIEQPREGQPARARAQPHALEQVLVNIILNALDAMADEESPRMEIRAWRHGDECFVSVCDNGHGIAPQDLDHLFDPFFTTKPVGKGTGLGLAISYRLIRSQGGTIEAESKGKGACFTIRLPAAEDAAAGG
jgi:two-component system C4-dicarboxylate transport sensor histidine kinase DctB